MSYRVRFGSLFLALIILLSPWGLGAAEAPVLDLRQLTSMALSFSPEVKASKSEARFAKEQQAEVKGYYYPQLDVVGVGGVVPNAKRPYEDLGGQ
ncbi:MAG: TolC family protein, partial [Desulfobaccales bacterium]